MTHQIHLPRKLLLSLLLLAACYTSTLASTIREKRHVGTEESSHPPEYKTQTPGSQKPVASGKSDNEITAEPGRKVSHRLIGGYLRTTTKQGRDDQALWDDGILVSSAGHGKEGKYGRADEDDDKKTLSQQVKEGKYGLIQNEIYGKRPKRPGIISYLNNPEVPKDNAENYGGLDEEEIWLAENHVLVLRGGKFPGHEEQEQTTEQSWPPIDDYKAPRRQVKIPPRPKVPPPFPVQLAEGGPIQIFRANGTKETVNGTFDYKTDPLYKKGLLPGEGPFFAVTTNGTILTSDSQNETDSRNANREEKRTEPMPPFYHAIPPGAVFVPPPSNQSDYDEEDQSIYYPPPYSFHYQQDNSTSVPPGPLVPGIILPPPPDFFSGFEERKSTTKKYAKRPGTTPLPRVRPTYLPPRKLTTKQYKTSTVPTTTVRRNNVSIGKTFVRTTHRNATRNAQRSMPHVEVTTARPEKSTTLENTDVHSVLSVIGNQVSEASTQEKSRTWSRELTTTKASPVFSYFIATTDSSLEKPVEVTPASVKSIVTTGRTGNSANQASYYFYEESNDSTTTASPVIYYKTTTESPFYDAKSQGKEEKKQYYDVETVPSEETSKRYNVKLINSLKKDQPNYEYNDSGATSTSSKYETTPARAQSQRMLGDQPIYYQAITGRPAFAFQSYYTTPKPQSYYRQPEQIRYDHRHETKSKPVYQYSFEAVDYSKRGNQRQPFYKQQQQQVYNGYQNTKVGKYDYVEQSMPEERWSESTPYKTQQPVYPSSTIRPDVTPNPQHAYFTQQDEKLLDDVTKEYFTIFGKKLTGKGIPSTTPMYDKSTVVTQTPKYKANTYVSNDYTDQQAVISSYKPPNVKVHYGDQKQRPYSLKDDILVNYRKPLPPINPDSEFITVVDRKEEPLQNYKIQEDYRVESHPGNHRIEPLSDYTSQRVVDHTNASPNAFVPSLTESREELQEAYTPRPVSLEDDIAVNYRDPRPPINPDAEFIDPVPGQSGTPEKSNAYFAYRLPGDSGHFYFLTPQAITQRQDQNGGYLYPKPRGPRLLRRRRGPGSV